MNLVKIIVSREEAELIVTGLLDMPFKQVNRLVHYIANEIDASKKAMPPNTVTVAPAQHKYGLKADGTPKKRPGRQRKEVKL
jgi:hypothetical protein